MGIREDTGRGGIGSSARGHRYCWLLVLILCVSTHDQLPIGYHDSAAATLDLIIGRFLLFFLQCDMPIALYKRLLIAKSRLGEGE